MSSLSYIEVSPHCIHVNSHSIGSKFKYFSPPGVKARNLQNASPGDNFPVKQPFRR